MADDTKKSLRKFEWILISIILVVTFFTGSYYGEKKVWASIETERDTVIKVVPVYKDFPDPVSTASAGYVSVPTYLFITDTVTNERYINVHDTTVVYLPREQKYYEEDEGRLRMWVSGYDPRLDRYELDHIEKVVTQTVIEKPSRWGISLCGGYGAALYNKTVILSPFIGVGVTYTFLRF